MDNPIIQNLTISALIIFNLFFFILIIAVVILTAVIISLRSKIVGLVGEISQHAKDISDDSFVVTRAFKSKIESVDFGTMAIGGSLISGGLLGLQRLFRKKPKQTNIGSGVSILAKIIKAFL